MYPKAFRQIAKQTFEYLDSVGGNPIALNEPIRTVALVILAQAAIDNGGLRFFFENDWPRKVSYSHFADAYTRIGLADGAKTITDAAASFGFRNPEKNVLRRQDFIEENYDEDRLCVAGWDDSLCGNASVYDALVDFVQENALDDFNIPKT